MILLIFEGVDNLGKSTIINKIVSNYKDVRDITMIHATGPKQVPGVTAAEVQEKTFMQNIAKCRILGNIESSHEFTKKNIAIMDRSHFGEYVYGQIYRNSTPEDILKMLHKVHDFTFSLTPVVIHLEASAEFVVVHDDNKSFTSNYDPDKRLATVQREIALFNECFNNFKLLNYMKINVEGENNNYRNIDDIYNEIMDNLSKLNIEL